MPAPGYGLTVATGEFPLLQDLDLLGGFRTVSSVSERNAIPFLNRKLGMWCWVKGDPGILYELTSLGTSGTSGTWTQVSFGSSAPSGTGPVKVSSGVYVVAAIDLASSEVTGILPSSKGGLPTFSSTGLVKVVSGVVQLAAAAVNLATEVTGTLPAANVATLPIDTKTSGSLDVATRATGVLPAANQAAQSIAGDGTGTTAALVVTKVNGISITGTPGVGYTPVGTSTTAAVWTAPAATPTGTGFTHYTSGTRDAAAKLVDLAADIDTATVLPDVNGGGKVRFASVTTSSSTPQLLASSAAIPSGGSAYVFASVLFHDASGVPYTMDITGLYQNNGGTITNVYGPNPSTQLGTLLNCAASLVVNTTTKKIELYGTNTGGTAVTMVPDLFAKVG